MPTSALKVLQFLQFEKLTAVQLDLLACNEEFCSIYDAPCSGIHVSKTIWHEIVYNLLPWADRTFFELMKYKIQTSGNNA